MIPSCMRQRQISWWALPVCRSRYSCSKRAKSQSHSLSPYRAFRWKCDARERAGAKARQVRVPKESGISILKNLTYFLTDGKVESHSCTKQLFGMYVYFAIERGKERVTPTWEEEVKGKRRKKHVIGPFKKGVQILESSCHSKELLRDPELPWNQLPDTPLTQASVTQHADVPSAFLWESEPCLVSERPFSIAAEPLC